MEVSNENEPVPIETKITAPIIWDVKPKFKIQDLRENYYDEVVTLIKHHYFREEAMCRSTKLLEDSESIEGYLNLIKIWMHDTTSLVAISKKSGRVVGAVISRINRNLDKTNTYSRVQILNGRALAMIMQLKNALIKQANAYKTMDDDIYLRVYILSVHPSYKTKGVADSLLACCSRVAASMKIPIVAGIFTTNADQLSALNVGFSSHTEIFYRKWIIDGKVIFNEPGDDNKSATFMIMSTRSEEISKS